jgi:TP53 regulating kinase and related kinases
MKDKIISQGAEAIVYLSENSEGRSKWGASKELKIVTKDRIPKSYRLKELDEKIRKHRTKSEKNLLEKACKIINAPNPFPLKELTAIEMPFIKGKRLSENLDSFSLEKQKEICKKIGEEIGKLHNADIIHGDLTTSNMILVDKKNSKNISLRAGGRELVSDSEPTIFFIDFGLGYISPKVEDKAVDLHLLKQALEAKHFRNWEILFNEVKKGYENYKESKKILERLKAVEKRGRYKGE